MMTSAPAATVYEPVGDLHLIAAYFNPSGYRSRRDNYERFRRPLDDAGLPLLTVECAFGDAAFELPGGDVLRVRAADVMWQKERLLNLAVSRLPPGCRKVAWLDADVLFENPGWAVETSRALDEAAFAQPFDSAVRLPRGAGSGSPSHTLRGFAAAWRSDPEALTLGDYERHGETGLAWAARRDLLEAHGLYDACIIGGGDHAMAHALCGDWTSPCVATLLGGDNPHRRHFSAWAARISAAVRGRLGHARGAALHLWHGEREHRRYAQRHRELAAFGFDPAADLRLGASACWHWASAKPALHGWAAEYFARRDEDGGEPPAAPASAPP